MALPDMLLRTPCHLSMMYPEVAKMARRESLEKTSHP